jgi:sugar lactone lactonase YvrE
MKRVAIYAVASCLSLCSQATGQVGIIKTVAGSGACCFSGDGGPATSASLGSPSGVAVDASANLYIADFSSRVRKVSSSGTITTVAGDGKQGFSGDGGPATSASLNNPNGIAVDASGNLFIADTDNNRIRKVSASGVISSVAGNGNAGFSGDGGEATAASLNQPRGVAVDSSGNLFIADASNSLIRKLSPNGIISTVAGDGNAFTCTSSSCTPAHGDGGPATSAGLLFPDGVIADAYGDLFIADTVNERVRKVSPNGIITTVAGNGEQSSTGDGGPATSASVQPYAVAVDASGNLFIADYADNVVRRVSVTGVISTVAGNGKSGFSGDGGPATSASVNPVDVAVDASGDLFIADFGNNRIRESSSSAWVVSAATFIPGAAVAPDSLIAVFGTGFATSTAQSTLDSNGRLPATLAGTSVEIDGQSAGLIFVSPSQINCVVPTNTAVGLATVVVYASGVQVGAGTVSIATTAPGLFSANGSGTGVAIAVNAITGATPPFPVFTQQNPTQLILWSTSRTNGSNSQRWILLRMPDSVKRACGLDSSVASRRNF